jgi:GNAT superfamily N-acetyltransferase
MVQHVIVSHADPFSSEALALLEELDRDLLERYPRQHIHGVSLEQLAGGRGTFVMAWLDGRPVGCGAIRFLEEEVGEIKRMYVRPDARRRGIARQLLTRLETIARELGFLILRLETGTLQPEAIARYERHGYQRIPPFGKYVNDLLSVCFEKRL